MILRKSMEAFMLAIVEGVKASMSRGRPGTAAEMSFVAPRAERIQERSLG